MDLIRPAVLGRYAEPYLSADESPIPALQQRQEAQLLYRLDVSRDAVQEKRYQLRVLFEFSDIFRTLTSSAWARRRMQRG